MMKNAWHWVLATVAVLTLPMWIGPWAFWKLVKSFKKEVLDEGGPI